MDIKKGREMVTENRSITLKTDVIEKVEELAKKETRSFSNMVQRILEKYFSKKESGKEEKLG